MTPMETETPDRLVTAVEERRPALLAVIRQARSRITLSLFRCNDVELFNELAAATTRGVAVEVLVTSRAKGGKKKMEKLWHNLERTGATLKAYTDPVVKYHAKYLVADEGPAVVASLNFTKKCFRKTCDALVITHDPAVVSGLRRLWAADCARAEMPEDLTDRLIVGPERARRQFTALVEQARSSIRLIDAKLSDPDLVALLNEKRAGGLTVDVFSSKRLGELTHREVSEAVAWDAVKRQAGAGAIGFLILTAPAKSQEKVLTPSNAPSGSSPAPTAPAPKAP